MPLFFLLCIVMPVLLGCVLSSGAGGRWLCGLLVGVVCYGILQEIMEKWFIDHTYSRPESAYVGILMAGATLGATSLLSLFLNSKDNELSVGVITLLVSGFYLTAYAFDFWAMLRGNYAPLHSRFSYALSHSAPGLLWTELLLLRAVWLIREGKGWHTPPIAPPSYTLWP